MKRSREELLVMGVYAFIALRLASEQLLGPFLSPTLMRLAELACSGAMFLCVFGLFLLGATARYRGWQWVLIAVFFIDSMAIVARGELGVGMKALLTDKFNGLDAFLAYSLPFVILSLPNRKYFRSILEVLFLSVLLVLPIWLLNAKHLVREEYLGEAIGVYLPFYCTVLFLFRRAVSRRKKMILYGIYFIYLLLMVLNARRNMIVSLVLYFAIAFVIGNLSLFKANRKLVLGGIAGLFALVMVGVASWQSLSGTVFSRLLDRATDDTRSNVELLFLIDMSSAPLSDWVFGRGMDGSYFQMVQDSENMEVTYDRKVVETGYLHMILKGGLFYVMLVLLFLFSAFRCGRKSGKPLVRGMAWFLPVYLLDMYMTAPLSYFSVRAVIFWLIVSVSYQFSRSRV